MAHSLRARLVTIGSQVMVFGPQGPVPHPAQGVVCGQMKNVLFILAKAFLMVLLCHSSECGCLKFNS